MKNNCKVKIKYFMVKELEIEPQTVNDMSLVVRKSAFCICENKDADQLRSTAQLISTFVFAIRIVQSLYYLSPKFQASSHLLWL